MENFQLENNNHTIFNLYDYQGKDHLLILFFRGAWCNHCKKQLQDFQTHLKELQERNIKLVAISSDSKLNSSLLKSFLKLKFPVLSDSQFKVINQFNLKTKYKDKEVSKPAIFLFSPDHKELFKEIGETYEDRISAKELLPELKKRISST